MPTRENVHCTECNRQSLPRKSDAKPVKSESEKASIEMMTNFLVLVSARKMKEALALCEEILKIEPRNKMLLEYKVSMTSYIKQGLDEPPSPEESEDEEEEEESDPDSENSDSEGDDAAPTR